MRWHRLTEEERYALRAPTEIEGLGMLSLTLFDRWERDAVFVLVRAFVDESGLGGEPRLMLAALVARAHRWFGFHRHWQRLLDTAEIPYSHIVDMEKGRTPFEGWDKKRTDAFVLLARRRINKNCDFGFTVAMAFDDHKEHYRAKLSDKEHKDSPYGAIARALIEAVVLEAVGAFGPETVVNFVFENNPHFEDARRVFRDLKDHVPEVSPHLGQIAPGDKVEFGGLQAADIVACRSRRLEPHAEFAPVVEHGTSAQKREDGRIRTFYMDLHPGLLQGHVRQAVEIAEEKRRARSKRQRENRARRAAE